MLTINKDERGLLIAINDLDDIPFEAKRIMFIGETPDNQQRGFHAHKENFQVLVCLSGKILLKTIFKNSSKELEERVYELTAGQHQIMPPMTWGEQTYYKNSSALVICSKKYDEKDYIRNYEEFKQA